MSAVAMLLTLLSADFDTDVLPVLTKAGCNAGACHGAAAGRGGFKLSLFAGDPAADYRAIVHDLEGRRVNLARPERSLLVLKPTWELDHEGGQRFDADSDFARLLLQWIEAGAPRSGQHKLAGIDVSPVQSAATALPAEVQLKVTASFAVGPASSLPESEVSKTGKTPAQLHARDVTGLAVYAASDPAATEVSPQGLVRILRPGRHTIIVRYLTHVAAVQITAPYPSPKALIHNARERVALDLANWIDDEINRTLTELNLTAMPPADDATLLRRLTLDLTGRLPTSERVRTFLADENREKLDAELDRLLASPEFTEFWTYRFAHWLGVKIGPNDAPGTKAYRQWLAGQIASSRPLDALVAELVIADGNSHLYGPANFHRAAPDARGQAEHVTDSLLAVRLRCANCHNHPLDRWTQDDYHGLAAIFARLERGPVVRMRDSGQVVHPVTGEAARLRIPGERFLEAQRDGRGELARWLIDRRNPYFARAWVNRFWQALLGRGLVEPADDLRATNPASHPDLLGRLAADFIQHGYDLRRTVRLICQSAAYRRSSPAGVSDASSDRFYTHAIARPLPPAVLLDAIADATGTPLEFREAGTVLKGRAIAAYDARLIAAELGPLAVCATPGRCSPGSEASLGDLAVQLHWLNGPILNRRLESEGNAFALLARADGVSNEKLIEDYYLRTLARLPRDAERAFWLGELDRPDREARCQDLAWSLLACREFVTNH